MKMKKIKWKNTRLKYVNNGRNKPGLHKAYFSFWVNDKVYDNAIAIKCVVSPVNDNMTALIADTESSFDAGIAKCDYSENAVKNLKKELCEASIIKYHELSNDIGIKWLSWLFSGK